MARSTKLLIAGAAVAVAAIGTAGGAVAVAGGGDDDAPITGEALDSATAAALAHTGGGRVTETEAGDDDSYYEVEVTLDDGTQVDVQLDESFTVVSSSPDGADGPGDTDDDGPITGEALESATAAALAHTGGGRVTATEAGDDDSYYEVEVTLDDGTQVDVQLDESFTVVSSSPDDDDDGDDDDGPDDRDDDRDDAEDD
jgi:uncharacterized membrane protein YkoI